VPGIALSGQVDVLVGLEPVTVVPHKVDHKVDEVSDCKPSVIDNLATVVRETCANWLIDEDQMCVVVP
jgi:hypothetical protein